MLSVNLVSISSIYAHKSKYSQHKVIDKHIESEREAHTVTGTNT
jgi:hypothetical protein